MSDVSIVINAFREKVDNSKEYSLKELNVLLTDAYNENKPKKAKSTTKRPMSAYNNFVKQTIVSLKKENPDIVARELMTGAANKWKELSQEEKDKYANTAT